MGSLSSPPKIPVVDFSQENLKPGTSSWVSTCKEVMQALEEYGCFEAVYDKVPLEFHKAFFKKLEELYDLPLETKRRNVSNIPYHGYVGNQPFIPAVYQGMGINNAATLEGTQAFTNSIWPEGNEDFCKTALEYSKLIAELEQTVMKMVFESYRAKQTHESHQESITYLFRLMKYRVPEKNEDDLGVGIHTDKCFVAALHQNEVSGLEVKTKDGQWILYEPSSPSSFIVNAGDALMAWSNDRIHAPLHRVVMRGSKEKARFSVGIFSFHKGVVQVPEELIDEQHPLRYKPFNNFDMLRYYNTEEGRAQENTVKAYCGI